MARKLRVEYPGAVYHGMNRGDRGAAIFRDDQDRQLLLSTLGEACGKTGWEVHALCLMGNHFHGVLETPRGNLVAGMKWFLGTYTGRFNRRHKFFGHLYSGRDKALIVDREGGIEASAVAGRVIGSTGQRGCWQSGTGGAIASGDGDDREMDCGAIADGNAGLSEPSPLPSQDRSKPQETMNMTISRTRFLRVILFGRSITVCRPPTLRCNALSLATPSSPAIARWDWRER